MTKEREVGSLLTPLAKGRGAYMAKEGDPPHGLRGGWGVPTWPKREVGSPSAPLAIPSLRPMGEGGGPLTASLRP